MRRMLFGLLLLVPAGAWPAAAAAAEGEPASPFPPRWSAIEAAWSAESADGVLAQAGADLFLDLPGVPAGRYSRDQGRALLARFFAGVETACFAIADKSAAGAVGRHVLGPPGASAGELTFYLCLVQGAAGGWQLDEIRRLDG